MGVVTIIVVVVPTKPQLQHLVHPFQDIQGFVDGRQACGWKLIFYLVVQLGGAGVPIAGGQQPQQSDALGRKPVFSLPELVYQFLESDLRIDHHLATFRFKIKENHSLQRLYHLWKIRSSLEG